MPEQIVKDNRQNQTPVSQDYLHEFLAFIRAKWPAMTIALAIVVVALLAWAFFQTRRQQQQIQAMSMLALAQTPAQFEEIINQHPNSPATALAMLSLAGQYYASAQYDQAQETYNRFLRAYPSHQWADMAQLGNIQCVEARGGFEQAIAQYDTFATTHQNDFMAQVAMFGKARCFHALNRFSDARAVYENMLVSSTTNSLWQRQAENLLALVARDERAQQKMPISAP